MEYTTIKYVITSDYWRLMPNKLDIYVPSQSSEYKGLYIPSVFRTNFQACMISSEKFRADFTSLHITNVSIWFVHVLCHCITKNVII